MCSSWETVGDSPVVPMGTNPVDSASKLGFDEFLQSIRVNVTSRKRGHHCSDSAGK